MAEILSIFPSTDTTVKLLTGGLVGAFATWLLNWWRERRSVNSALAAEVDRICEAIEHSLFFIRGKDGTTIQEAAKGVPWLPFRTPVWDGLVDQLGVLGSRRAREVG